MTTKAKALGALRPFDEYQQHDTDMRAHLPRIRDLIIGMDAQVVVELGVRHGYSSAALLHGLRETGGALTSVEVAHPQPFVDPQWTFIGGDDLAPGVLARIPESIDLLFIDTEHTLQQTVQELALYGPRVRDGGVVVCHDTCLHGVHVALRDLYEQRGVHWDEWRESYGLAVVTLGPVGDD